MEGVERYKVNLLPHNPFWKEEFIEAKDKFETVLNDVLVDIQHVGSTAIPTSVGETNFRCCHFDKKIWKYRN